MNVDDFAELDILLTTDTRDTKDDDILYLILYIKDYIEERYKDYCNNVKE